MVETSTLVEVLHSYSNKARHYLYHLDKIVEAKPRAAAPAPVERPQCRHKSRARVALRMDASDKLELLERYKEGVSSRELSEAFGISKGSVIRLVRSAGISIRRRSLTEAEAERAIRMYESGSSLDAIGRTLGFATSTIRNELMRRKVDRRCPHGHESDHCYGKLIR